MQRLFTMLTYHRLIKISRKDASSGLWLGFIVPALLLKTDNKALAYEFFLSVITVLFLTKNNHFKHAVIPICIWLNCQHFHHVSTLIRSLFIIIFVLCFSYRLLSLFPFSFTFGETVLLAHLSAVFLFTECNFALPFLILFLIERYSIRFSLKIAFSVLITLTILTGYLWIYACRVQIATSFILNQIECFIISTNFILLMFWLCLFMLCVYITIIYRCSNHNIYRIMNSNTVKPEFCDSSIALSDEPSLSDQSEYHELCSENEFIKNNHTTCDLLYDNKEEMFKLRKLFHFAAGIVYSSGLLYSPHLLSLMSVALLIVFWCFEWIRRRGPSTLSSYLSTLVDPFRDKRDSGDILFTPIALLLGLSIPVWWPQNRNTNRSMISIGNLCYELDVKPSSWSGVLSVAIGDSFAALIGRAYGKRRWPGSHRTFLGSFASFFSQIIVWTILSYYYSWHWLTGVIPLLIGVLIEAYIDQIDNLVIPLIVMLMFHSL
ncbi:unnamed protein product [Schistosoma rodhaini]|uniref:dolichol kinase n=1 Tax=Schistosoma rodhaini TaxID=6188 RepID=A0AA85FHY9_9TREM|nr:unnamed protein product [Schistosoma rodhaini]